MPSEYDATEFVDADFQAHKTLGTAASAPTPAQRAPTREEVDSKVADAQQKLAELKRAQEELERERAELEESRRRQIEFQAGRQELTQHLTRGLGLLEEAEFSARRDAEQMAKTIADLRDAMSKIQSIHEEAWTKDNFAVELTRALTTIENARMEWNSAKLKFLVLSGSAADPGAVPATRDEPAEAFIASRNFAGLCKMGLALTWPLAAVALLALAALVIVLLRH
jgi:hypothetical protein